MAKLVFLIFDIFEKDFGLHFDIFFYIKSLKHIY